MSAGLIILLLIWSGFLFSLIVLSKHSGISGAIASIVVACALTSLLLIWPQTSSSKNEGDLEKVTDAVAWPRILLLVMSCLVAALAIGRTNFLNLFVAPVSPIKMAQQSDDFFPMPT
ncbi:hypothetical protein L596_003543 [Steinernema carpocapsae]|uniref:Uncharacterized protein n=1 Tax=Steinernema carpocapsae TaxID=34508 RepID=A0A4U8UW34_STECR|nr:hypothetical protein L596_003543 [Steinernema carpocapsae]